MMGANWQPDMVSRAHEKFAWLPIKTESGKLIWLKKYMSVQRSAQGANLTWTLVYTKNEYFLKQLKGA